MEKDLSSQIRRRDLYKKGREDRTPLLGKKGRARRKEKSNVSSEGSYPHRGKK